MVGCVVKLLLVLKEIQSRQVLKKRIIVEGTSPSVAGFNVPGGQD